MDKFYILDLLNIDLLQDTHYLFDTVQLPSKLLELYHRSDSAEEKNALSLPKKAKDMLQQLRNISWQSLRIITITANSNKKENRTSLTRKEMMSHMLELLVGEVKRRIEINEEKEVTNSNHFLLLLNLTHLSHIPYNNNRRNSASKFSRQCMLYLPTIIPKLLSSVPFANQSGLISSCSSSRPLSSRQRCSVSSK